MEKAQAWAHTTTQAGLCDRNVLCWAGALFAQGSYALLVLMMYWWGRNPTAATSSMAQALNPSASNVVLRGGTTVPY